MPDRAAPAGSSPATKDEIEITPEMIEAGCDVLRDYEPDIGDIQGTARLIFLVTEIAKAMGFKIKA